MSRARAKARRGFTMLTMLWILSVASVAAMAAALAGRTAVDSGKNRVSWERAYWRAMGCARRAQAAIDASLDTTSTSEAAVVAWRTVGRTAGASTLVAGCDVSFEAAGTRLDLNGATDEMISRLTSELGYTDQVEDMVAALDLRRASPFADSRELASVRGFEDFARFDTLVSAEPGRVSLSTAPVGVLLTVPGITLESAELIVARQQAGTPITALVEVMDAVSEAASSVLAARFPDALRSTTPDPDAWLIRSNATSGLPSSAVVLDWRASRVGRRAVVVQTRSNQ